MKTIVLFRHAQAASAHDDHERPLTADGARDAGLTGRLLALADQVPQAALVSTAKRAQETFERASTVGGWSVVPRLEARLYESTPDRCIEVIREQSNGVSSLLLVGHQPTWSQLVERFVGTEALEVAPGAALRIDLAIQSWSELDYGRGSIAWLFPPRLWHRGSLAAALGDPS